MVPIKTTAIPLVYHPYSSTSRIVHWLTRHHGKITTLLKGALRSRSPFLGEYELFSTSELLYFPRRIATLHPAKECAMITPRETFRTDWRASLSASYITALINRTTPEEAPLPGLFSLYEGLLDHAAIFGSSPAFPFWAELQLCHFHGHSPHLANCTQCGNEQPLRFSAECGGTICTTCARTQKIPTLESPPDVLAILRRWQQAPTPAIAAMVRINPRQHLQLNTLMEPFLSRHLNLPPQIRHACVQSGLD